MDFEDIKYLVGLWCVCTILMLALTVTIYICAR